VTEYQPVLGLGHRLLSIPIVELAAAAVDGIVVISIAVVDLHGGVLDDRHAVTNLGNRGHLVFSYCFRISRCISVIPTTTKRDWDVSCGMPPLSLCLLGVSLLLNLELLNTETIVFMIARNWFNTDP
jgi:hypothetical protein